MPDPFFSIVVPTYQRARIVRRCVDSCLEQSFSDFEVVVVDDASTDDTVSMLNAIGDERLRVVVHESNRGISPSRYTGVQTARGQWIVPVDSDWELFPYTLERLREVVEDLPEGVRVVRGRMQWDDGRVTPATVPSQPIGYEGRIRGWEQDWDDAVQCMHRAVFEETPYISDRRGVVEALFELNMARVETSVWVEDVLGREHSDAENSWIRSVDASEVIPRLTREAPDMLWMVETTLQEHGGAIAANAPSVYRVFLRMASTQAFLVGDRRKGLRYGWAALRLRKVDPMVWGSLLLGLLGPWAVARATLVHRRALRLKALAGARLPGAGPAPGK